MQVAPHTYQAKDIRTGAEAQVKRVFPTRELKYIDPFVLLEEFTLGPAAGFPPHPHRGFEVVTYVEGGSLRHKDNLGHDVDLLAGGAQRITVGSGVVYEESPGISGMAHGFQLWVNLPKELKMRPPDYQEVMPDAIPEARADNFKVRRIIGEGSPVRLHTPVLYEVMEVYRTSHPLYIPLDFASFIYVYDGELHMPGIVRQGEVVLLAGGEQYAVWSDGLVRFLLLEGIPHGEPIYLHGSFVD